VSTAAVILAAGFSRRLGQPKQTLMLQGETLVERAARIAAEAGLVPVIVVVHRDADFCELLEKRGCVIAMNEQAAHGIASSIRRGVTVAQTFRATGVVLLTCDQIAMTREHLHQVAANPATVTASSYAGRNGVPAYFPASHFDDLLHLHGDTGARELLRHAHSVANEALAIDIDTEEDLSHVQGQAVRKLVSRS
jgi:molybdenum cofactor cytidylyltransferase